VDLLGADRPGCEDGGGGEQAHASTDGHRHLLFKPTHDIRLNPARVSRRQVAGVEFRRSFRILEAEVVMSGPASRSLGSLATSLVLAASLGGCYLEGPHSRDEHRTVDQIRQEHAWAADEIGRRLTPEDLERVRAGESSATRQARRRFLRLLDALDRLAWMREAAPRGLWASVEEPQDQDELAFRFARAGKLRGEAFAEADEIAEALANSPAPDAIKWPDLKRALMTLAQAEASEEKVARELAALITKEKGLRAAGSRFPTMAPPLPRPFVAAAAAYLRAHPSDRIELERLPPELMADAKRIRSAVDEAPPPAPPPVREEVRPVPSRPSADEQAAVRDRAAQAHAEADAAGKATSGGLLQIAGDARQMLTARGLPAAVGRRPDGSFTLRYEEQRPCASGSCATLVDYLFNESGSLMHEEVVGPAPSAAPQQRRMPDENAGDPE
jgi:hypothetical protein